MNISLHSSNRVLKGYIETLTVFSHLLSPDSLNDALLSQGYIFGTAPTVGTVGRVYIPRTEEEVRSLRLPGSNSTVNQQSCPLVYFLQQFPWLVWLSGLSVACKPNGHQFDAESRAHAWVVCKPGPQ